MDPDTTLHMLRDLARRLLDAADDSTTDDSTTDLGDFGDDVANMAELFQHLDRWIIRKGALPEAWKPRG